MSHSHSHAPGEEHSHSHAPQQPQTPQLPPPDPTLQALIDQSYTPNVVSQKLTTIVTSTKDEGNALFKAGLYAQAISKYTTAVPTQCNGPLGKRTIHARGALRRHQQPFAAYHDTGDFISALADADTVISVRRNWSKGHFRKAKALLGLQRPDEAAEAVRLGLSFEPANAELLNFLREIEKNIGEKEKA
ncbi:hypothetical protein BDQ17DRAFT_1367929 [Cyathus striatus]|nr:hypothetical protein BDQ17DRAFT_1367929 [Cyathus striatus]